MRSRAAPWKNPTGWLRCCYTPMIGSGFVSLSVLRALPVALRRQLCTRAFEHVRPDFNMDSLCIQTCVWNGSCCLNEDVKVLKKVRLVALIPSMRTVRLHWCSHLACPRFETTWCKTPKRWRTNKAVNWAAHLVGTRSALYPPLNGDVTKHAFSSDSITI